jgi:hypothetical protein
MLRDSSRNDLHNTVARHFFREQNPKIGLHRLRRKTGDPQFLIELGLYDKPEIKTDDARNDDARD